MNRRRTLRIIGGNYRSRKVSFPDLPAIRPTPDRVRETLFNWLQLVVPGSRCLELYAGSGVLSIEALSRGAAHVDIVENDRGTLAAVSENLGVLGCDKSRFDLHCTSASAFLQAYAGPPYDVVFLDPPFAVPGELASTLAILAKRELVQASGHVYIESAEALDETRVGPDFQILKQKRAGQVHYCTVGPASLN